MNSESFIFLAGASRGVGREIAKYLREQGKMVKALLRSPDTQAELKAMGIEVVMGDALDAEAVKQAMSGSPISAVISTIGGLPKDGERADYLGNKNLIDAAVQAGVEKFILVSSIGSGNSRVALPPQALETLGAVLIEKEKAEQHLIDSGLNYTIIRPGGLKSEPATGNGILTENYSVSGTIHRADVAQLACRCLQSPAANNKVLSALDNQMIWSQIEFEVLSLD
ncbi:SDR family oxidoreductase [Limnoraphis robusta Tam1]|uniref:SDR family oxidoreductase n=1 Tax=Limnoraphis robusta CCNP1315 TaxID=3110306 RepID=A0ABU5U107_9CYAN|nr:SDR family oxidoreductase [Limnoraphis robusta]MEA5499115.1 SDR family oxidoreductase [Limnoraphis robusta BA-68 BA1]MEA5520750.1 SDR family oxidoreductase [Limnoraphis robusta CCNP1315]MEA5542167.1 SDR family oxidoreductase [Limnoraphis robusta Tam1]MEA5546635.1 SDR family oxidoreductase [Limnoraphis robusta CCNP1324]